MAEAERLSQVDTLLPYERCPAKTPERKMALKQVQLLVRGRVQGVYFRASAQREARRLGLTGWVKNRADGSVEIVAEGEEVAIRELYGWAQKGPSAARVDRVETRWRSYSGEFPDFRIVD
jgi:acylphosphatase